MTVYTILQVNIGEGLMKGGGMCIDCLHNISGKYW